MAKAGKTGVTASTPNNILLGAGTIHKNLKYESTKWNLDTSIIGATKEGSSLEIIPEFYEVEPDGALVSVKGLTFLMGGSGQLNVNFLEFTKELLTKAIAGTAGTSEDINYDLIETKSDLEDNDYYDNIAFVGKTAKGQNIIIILENALCISGLSLEGKNKEANTAEYIFKAHADIAGDLDTIPVKIYTPKEAN